MLFYEKQELLKVARDRLAIERSQKQRMPRNNRQLHSTSHIMSRDSILSLNRLR